jgi:hypothetical protein
VGRVPFQENSAVCSTTRQSPVARTSQKTVNVEEIGKKNYDTAQARSSPDVGSVLNSQIAADYTFNE